MERVINEIASKVKESENHYIGQDGLKHCSKCGEPLEAVMKVAGKERKVGCICSCMKAEQDKEAEKERKEEIERNRRRCFSKISLSSCRFENSTENEFLTKCKNYCKHFSQMKKDGIGILMYGGVGTGKSHLAACIANELIDNGYSVLMTNFATIVNNLQASFDGREEYLNSLNRYSLLILDDLGAERNTEFMSEQIFNVINSRYAIGLPMIITTNLTGEEMRNASNVNVARIYDRIAERCHPMMFKGESKRRRIASERFCKVEAILNGEYD